MTLSKTKGFTLVELIIGLAVSTIVIGAVLGALSGLERSFLASEQYSQANADEQRVMDYVSRDLRGAYTVTVSGSAQSVTMTLPDYYGGVYDAQGNPTGTPVTPTVSNGVLNYGNASQPLTVTYYLSGRNLVRQQTVGVTGSVSQIVVSNNVESLATSYMDLTSIVQLSVTFTPIYQWHQETSSAIAGTTLTASVSVRNVRRD